MPGAISKAIDAQFENSDAATKTETEQAFQAGFIAMAGNLAFLLNGIGLAVAFTILLVTANTMSIAVRERQQEIAVLKTLGFSSGLVMTLILSEALLIGVMGGAVGLLISAAALKILPEVPMLGDIVAQYPNFGLVDAYRAAGNCRSAGAGTVRRLLPGYDRIPGADYGDFATGIGTSARILNEFVFANC